MLEAEKVNKMLNEFYNLILCLGQDAELAKAFVIESASLLPGYFHENLELEIERYKKTQLTTTK